MNNLSNDRPQNFIDQTFSQKQGDELKSELLNGYGADNDVTYLLSHVKLSKGERPESKISVVEKDGHLVWKVNDTPIEMGSSFWDRFKVGYKQFKYKVKVFLNFSDYEERSRNKLERKINLITQAFENRVKNESQPVSLPKKIEEAPTEARLLDTLVKASPKNETILRDFFSPEGKMENPEGWAEILPVIRNFLRRNQTYQAIWEKLIDQKFDSKIDEVCIQLPNSNEMKLPKAFLITQSQTFKEYRDDRMLDEDKIALIDLGTDSAKVLFCTCMQEGLKGKALDYPADLETALNLLELANFYSVNWLLNDLEAHITNTCDPNEISKALIEKKLVSHPLQSDNNPFELIYISCIKTLIADSLEYDSIEKFNEFVNDIKEKNDEKLIDILQKLTIEHARRLATELKTLSDNIPHERALQAIDQLNIVAPLNPDLIREFPEHFEELKMDILNAALNPMKLANQDVMQYLRFAHQEDDGTVYNYVKERARDLAYKVTRGGLDPDHELALLSIQDYAFKNKLLDLQIYSSPGLDIFRDRLTYEVSWNQEGNSKQVKILQDLVLKNPDGKMLKPLSLNIQVKNYNPTEVQIKDIQSLIQLKLFNEVNLNNISDGHAKGLVSALENGCPALERIVIFNKDTNHLTSHGLETIISGLKNSKVREFKLDDSSVSISMDTAKVIAEVIKSNDTLETLVLGCPFENRDAFNLIFNAVKANQKLNTIKLSIFIRENDEVITRDEKKQLESQREGLTFRMSF